MGVRPLDGSVAIAECASRSEADAAVARLAAHGIDAMAITDPATAAAPHVDTDRRFPVVVRIAIADDAQQVLARAGFPTGVRDPSPLVHPVLRPRSRPPGPPASTPPPTPGHQGPDAPAGTGRSDWSPGASPSPADPEDFADDDASGPLRRPRWVKPVAWLTAASVVVPLLATAARALSQL